MSAAEKLRALDEALVDAPWFYEAGMTAGMDRTGSVWARPNQMLTLVMSKPPHNPARELMALRNALPQIVAVIEAAEKGRDRSVLIEEHVSTIEKVAWRVEDAQTLQAALVALNETLT